MKPSNSTPEEAVGAKTVAAIDVGSNAIRMVIAEVLDDGRLEGIDAVVDKDLASRVLATEIGAEDLIILTEIEKVATDFGGPDERWLDRLTVAEAKALAAEGHFPPGSMGPKMRACLEFLEAGGQRAIVTNPENMSEAFQGRGGTQIVP